MKEDGVSGLNSKTHMELLLKWMRGRKMLKLICNQVGSSKKFFHTILPEDPQQDQPEPPLYCHIRFTLLHRNINWQLDVIIGCFMFPFINRLSQLNLNLLPLPPTSSPMSLSSVEQSIMARDLVAMALYAVVVSICALANFNVQRMLPLVWSSFGFDIRKVKELVTFNVVA